jgi:hypothetical protein
MADSENAQITADDGPNVVCLFGASESAHSDLEFMDDLGPQN